MTLTLQGPGLWSCSQISISSILYPPFYNYTWIKKIILIKMKIKSHAIYNLQIFEFVCKDIKFIMNF